MEVAQGVKHPQPSHRVQSGHDGRTRIEDARIVEGTHVEGTGSPGSSDAVPTVLLSGRPSQPADREPTVVLSTLTRVNHIDTTARRQASVAGSGATAVQHRTIGAATPGRLRTNLPGELVRRYQPLYDLKVYGGQADLVRCIRRSDGADVVVKLYKSAAQLDREVLSRLYRADPRHVVRLLEHGETEGEPWEVQEFCRNGNLAEYRLQQGGRLRPALCLAALQQLTDAIAHVHGLGITHRDLKPANILVRDVHPQLDLVLTDFGVAADQVSTVLMQTVAASWPWAAPEVHTKGQVARPIDWWALGAIMHQLVSGRHLLAGTDGTMPSDKEQRAIIVDGRYTTEAIEDRRWRNLVDGLLAYQPADRWGETQVRDWLAGHDPPVVRTVPLASLRRVSDQRPVGYVINGHRVANGRELVAALRSDWDEIARHLGGEIDQQLAAWLRGIPEGAGALRAMQLEDSVGARWVRLQGALDPQAPLDYRGRGLDRKSLDATIRAAQLWRPGASGQVAVAHDWLMHARYERALRAAAAVLEGGDAERLARADQALHRWWLQTYEVWGRFGAGRLQQLIEENDRARLAESYAVALGQADGREIIRAAAATAKQAPTGQLAWSDRLVDQVINATGEQWGLVVAAEPVIAEVIRSTTALARREQEERKQWARQQRQARRRVRATRLRTQLWGRGALSLGYALICAALVAIPGAGMAAALRVAAVVLGVCAVSLSLAGVVDWFADDPRGGLRRLGAGVGLAIGLGVWGQTLASGSPITAAQCAVLPAAYGTGWAVGGLLHGLLERAVADRAPAQPDPVRALVLATSWLVALGVTSGISALVFRSGGAALAGLYSQLALQAEPWAIDPFGLAGQPVLVGALAAVAVGLQTTAVRLGRLWRRLGIGATALASVLSVVIVLGYPANLAIGLLAAAWG
ncbi:MAG: protein kinase [Acidobacteriota bacterium]|nr:protein kinase [Acidobacteriota bacterium]